VFRGLEQLFDEQVVSIPTSMNVRRLSLCHAGRKATTSAASGRVEVRFRVDQDQGASVSSR
jgi:hypothetical protein